MKASVAHVMWDINGVFGGGERAALSIARATNDICRCECFSIGCEEVYVRDGVVIRPIRRRGGTFDNPVPSLRDLRSAVDSVDIIHVHQMNTLMLDIVLAIRKKTQGVVVTDYGGAGVSVNRLFHWFRGVDAFVAYSRTMRSACYGNSPKIVSIPLPFDSEWSRREMVQADGHTGVRVLSVGRVLPHKGFETVIKALPVGGALRIVGRVVDLQYFTWLKSLDSDGVVEFLVDADDKTLHGSYEWADVLVMPSVSVDYRGRLHTKAELFGLVVLEAALFGLPLLVSSEVPALREGFDAGALDGGVFPAGEVAALRRLLEGCLSGVGSSVRNRMFVLERFAPDVVARAYSDLYAAVVGQRRK